MAARILKADLRTVVWNRTASKAFALAEQGAVVASSPADLASRCQIVRACLSNAEVLKKSPSDRKASLSNQGTLGVLIDNSTIHLGRTRQFAERLRHASGAGCLTVRYQAAPSAYELAPLQQW